MLTARGAAARRLECAGATACAPQCATPRRIRLLLLAAVVATMAVSPGLLLHLQPREELRAPLRLQDVVPMLSQHSDAAFDRRSASGEWDGGSPSEVCRSGAPLLPAGERPKPLVTFITPFYNVDPSQFRAAAECVLRQSMTAWEWIVLDDFSTADDSIAALEETSLRSARIRVLRMKDVHAASLDDGGRGDGGGVQTRNVARARNAGARAAAGQFIVFHDGDDLIDPLAAEKWLLFLVAHPDAHFVNSFCVGFGAHHYVWRKGVNPGAQFRTENVATVAAMHRRDSFLSIGGFAEQRPNGLEDWEMWLRYADAAMWGFTLPELLVWYRRRESHGDRWSDFSGDGLDRFRAELPSRFPRLALDRGWPAAPVASVQVLAPAPPALLAMGEWASSATASPRFVLIVPWLVVGGADRFNLVLLQGLKARGWHCTVVTTLPSDHPWLGAFYALTSDIVLLDTLAPAPLYLEVLHNILLIRQPDAVMVTNSFHGYAMLPFLRAAHPRCVFVDYTHMEEDRWRAGGHVRWGVALQPLLDANFVASSRLRTWMVARGADESRIHIEYVGVDLREWQPDEKANARVRALLDLTATDVVVLYACRLVEQKQPLLAADVFVEVLLRQRATGPAYTKFVVAGAGPLEGAMRARLRARLNAQELACVIFLGPVPQASMQALTQAADVAFLPSVMEGIPTTFFEAMALGIVVVGADVGAISELVADGETGFLVRYDGIDELAAEGRALEPSDPRFMFAAGIYAEHIYELSTKPKLRASLAAAAAMAIRRFDVDVSVADIHRRLLELVGQRRGSSTLGNNCSIADLERARKATGRGITKQAASGEVGGGSSGGSSGGGGVGGGGGSDSAAADAQMVEERGDLLIAAEAFRWALTMEHGTGAVVHPL